MRKKDEMENYIANKAFKISWSITWFALFIAGLIGRYVYDNANNIFELFAWGSLMIVLFTEQYLLSKIHESNQIKKIIAVTALIVFILLAIGWFTR